MLVASVKAKEKLREQLIHKCFEVGIGYRLLFSRDNSGNASFSIMLDKQRQDDEVSELGGIMAFVDPDAARNLGALQLDYVDDEPDGGFYLKIQD